MLFFDEINIFEVLENEEKFYINEQGQVVISFDRYESPQDIWAILNSSSIYRWR